MIYIAIGSLGFVLLQLFDIVALKRVPVFKPIIWTLSNGLVVWALIMICLQPDRLSLPSWTIWVGLALLIISGTLLIFSLFINLPFRKTYVTTTKPRLVTSGLYSLVRHPWVISLSLLLVSLVFVSRSRDLLIATPVWISLAILSTVLKDRFLFGRMFGGYEAYRRETPMLLPNRKSITVFINGLRGETSFRRLHTNE